MNPLLNTAIELTKKGFYIIPLIPNKKLPLFSSFTEKATRDASELKTFWRSEPNANIGIISSKFRENEALLIVDIDVKNGKKGEEVFQKLKEDGKEFPPTYSQTTPTGGIHYFYRIKEPVRQGVNVLGPGIDIRSKGGYVVGPGSQIDGKFYQEIDLEIVEAPVWLIEACGKPPAPKTVKEPEGNVSIPQAVKRAIQYLEEVAPIAVEGAGGDATSYQVACRLKDFGLSKQVCFELMSDYWNERCYPPWSSDELLEKVTHAYRYGLHPIGVDAPEKQFSVVKPDTNDLHPFDELNKEYAFLVTEAGPKILWETTDVNGRDTIQILNPLTFHTKFASHTMDVGEKREQVTKLWLKSNNRREYDGICFDPSNKASSRFYNLWKGFAVTPYPTEQDANSNDRDALNRFLDHALENICCGEKPLYDWLIGYFAHMFQKPWEKHQTAIVFKGSKGTGKNALIERIGYLLGSHYLLTSDRRYLVGNFNSHLKNLLFFVLDEAFWSGDKQADGVLKSLISGSEHVIEHKGAEPYRVSNCTRIAIIGNEDWLVPASHDERRYAVFNVGEGKKQHTEFFQKMREGMERGGYRLLLRYLLNVDISPFNFFQAPNTKGLVEQKTASLGDFDSFIFECLMSENIVSSDLSGWPVEISCDRFREAYYRYRRDRNIRSRAESTVSIGKKLKQIFPDIKSARVMEDRERRRFYILPELQQARKEWDLYVKNKTDWEA